MLLGSPPLLTDSKESKQMHRQTGEEQSNNFDEDIGDGDQESMLRKLEAILNDAASVGKMNHEPRFVVETMSEVDLDDGYHWQKYRQKIVNGNPYLRSSYKCTSVDCPVRKHVERALHDPKVLITTYEARHNHEVPT